MPGVAGSPRVFMKHRTALKTIVPNTIAPASQGETDPSEAAGDAEYAKSVLTK